MRRKRYIGWRQWRFRVGESRGVVDIVVTSGNYAEDEGFARYRVRKKLNLKKLPKGSTVFPDYPNG